MKFTAPFVPLTNLFLKRPNDEAHANTSFYFGRQRVLARNI